MMEGPKSMDGNSMRFEEFKNNIAATFEREGLSENLRSMIEDWIKFGYAGRIGAWGSSGEQRVGFQMELAQIFGATEQYDDSWETLSKAWDYAHEMYNDELVQEIENLMDKIHGRKDGGGLP